MAFDYAQYVEDFNTNEDADLIARYFCEEAAWDSAGGERWSRGDRIARLITMAGRDGIVNSVPPF
jgi:hypothetical protein